jgi:phage terminase small subunit
MPAKKAQALNKRHSTKEEKEARVEAEKSLTPKSQLTLKPPAALSGHAHASAMWKWLLGLYGEIEGQIVTTLDRDILIEYCLLDEEIVELEKLRVDIRKDYESMRKTAQHVKITPDNVKDVVSLWQQVNAIGTRFQGMDARLDGKRKHRLSLSQSLYLNPRSRAGVAPTTKEPEAPEDPMAKLVNG